MSWNLMAGTADAWPAGPIMNAAPNTAASKAIRSARVTCMSALRVVRLPAAAESGGMLGRPFRPAVSPGFAVLPAILRRFPSGSRAERETSSQKEVSVHSLTIPARRWGGRMDKQALDHSLARRLVDHIERGTTDL